MKKLICGFMVSLALFLGLSGSVLAKSYTAAETFKIKSFGAYTISTNSKKKSKTCSYGYFRLTTNDNSTCNKYCVFVTTNDTSTAVTKENSLSKSKDDERRIYYTTNYVDINTKTMKAKVRSSSLEPSAGTVIRGQFSAEN
ncbi:MAG: hypothetical protein LUG60_04150 [Erysipelotrichaceae bacterium]|nr:hypothetical protein [Erysipelotrichaceae bacterium]